MSDTNQKPVHYIKKDETLNNIWSENQISVEYFNNHQVAIYINKKQQFSKMSGFRYETKQGDFQILGMKYCKINSQMCFKKENNCDVQLVYYSNFRQTFETNFDFGNYILHQYDPTSNQILLQKSQKPYLNIVIQKIPKGFKITPQQIKGMKIITPSFHNQIKLIYLIDGDTALCIRKVQNRIMIGMLKFSNIENWKQLFLFENYDDASFGWMDLQNGLVMLALKQSNNIGQVVVLDYKLNKIIYVFNTNDIESAHKKMDPNLQHFFDIERNDTDIKLVHYYKSDTKRLYMSLMKQKGISKQYGTEIFRRVIQNLT